MIHADRGALICDLAETYGIYDYRSLPARTVATFSVGLRDNSRIKTILRGGRAMDDTDVLIALVHDRLADVLTVLGAFSERPDSIASKLMGIEDSMTKKSGDTNIYVSATEFEKARKGLIESWEQN